MLRNVTSLSRTSLLLYGAPNFSNLSFLCQIGRAGIPNKSKSYRHRIEISSLALPSCVS